MKNENETQKEEYKNKLVIFGQEELYEETKRMIWLSAFANNNPRSDYHWMCDFCYNEWKNRNKIEKYDKAHKEVLKECGY